MKKIKINILNITFIFSLMITTFLFSSLATYYEPLNNYVYLSSGLAFIIGWWLCKKNIIINTYHKNIDKVALGITIYMFLCIMITLFTKYNMEKFRLYMSLNIPFGNILLILLSSFAIFTMLFSIAKIVVDFARKFILELDDDEKKVIKYSFIIIVPLILFAYTLTGEFWHGFDLIYSTDSYSVSKIMYADIFFLEDIRHILYEIFAGPFYYVSYYISKIFSFSMNLHFILLSVFNYMLLLSSAIMLKRITNKKIVMYLYLASFPFIFYSFIIEKYQLCVFFLILFVYSKIKKDERIEGLSFIGAIGTMATSVFLGFFLGEGKWKEKWKIWVKYALLFLAIVIITGRLGVIIRSITQFETLTQGIPVKLGMMQRFYGVTELFNSCFFAPRYAIVNGKMIWDNAAYYLNKVGFFLIILSVIGIWVNRKEKSVQISSVWILSILFVFLGLNWYGYEAPLFNVYYSWAILIVLVLLVEKIFVKFPNLLKAGYIISIILMLMINVSQMIEIFQFVR